MNTREKTVPAVSPNLHENGSSDEVPTSDTRSGPPRRVIFGALGFVLAVVVIIFGVKWFLYASAHQGTDDARVDADTVSVTSKIAEKIDNILVDTNDAVRRGQVLIVLDANDERAKLQQAQAQFDLARATQRTMLEQNQGGVSQAQANVTDAQAQVPISQAGVSQAAAQLRAAQAQLPAAQASLAQAQADFNRIQALVSTGDVPRQQLDGARAQLAGAQAQYRAATDQVRVAQANLVAAQQKVGASIAGVNAMEGGVTTAQGKLAQSADPSQVEAAKASLDLSRQNMTYTHVTAPIDGYVGEKSAVIGQTVSPGTTLLTLIPSDPKKIYITANYKETQMGDMRTGQAVDIHVDAYKGVTFHGHVISINPASQNTYALVPAQNATGNFVKVTQRIPVRISIDDQNTSTPLRPGMSVETYVQVRQ